MARSSPTARTLALLRSEGWEAQVVEHNIPGTFIKRDLFHCIDVIGIKLGEPVLGVQVTTGAHVADRIQKIAKFNAMDIWRSVARLEVHGWRKVGPRGERKVWECRRVRL